MLNRACECSYLRVQVQTCSVTLICKNWVQSCPDHMRSTKSFELLLYSNVYFLYEQLLQVFKNSIYLSVLSQFLAVFYSYSLKKLGIPVLFRIEWFFFYLHILNHNYDHIIKCKFNRCRNAYKANVSVLLPCNS